MALGALYLIDKSAWARASNEQVGSVLEPMIDAGTLATCSITNLEILYSTRNAAEYAEVADELASFDLVSHAPTVIDGPGGGKPSPGYS